MVGAYPNANEVLRNIKKDKPDVVLMDIDMPEVNGIETKANTHVVTHAGRIYALVESSLPTEMHPDLSTVGACDFGGALTTPFTAHPKVCPTTGELLGFGYSLFEPYLAYLRVSAANAM